MYDKYPFHTPPPRSWLLQSGQYSYKIYTIQMGELKFFLLLWLHFFLLYCTMYSAYANNMEVVVFTQEAKYIECWPCPSFDILLYFPVG
jgi:hypothetical protein